MNFYVCYGFVESAKQKEYWSKQSHMLILFRLEKLPAKHVQYFCLAIRRQYWPIPLVNTRTIGTFEDGAHHCISVYGVSRLKVILGFLPAADGDFLPSITALDFSC